MPEETKRAYKVVREDNGAWKSAIINGKACITYALGQRSYGIEGTPVTVFLFERTALAWRDTRSRVLLRGTAGNPRPQRRLVRIWPVLRVRSVVAFWARGDKYRGGTMEAPTGTHAADWFEAEEVVPRAR